MVLIKSISGVRGTINGTNKPHLSDDEIVKCIKQFVFWIIPQSLQSDSVKIGCCYKYHFLRKRISKCLWDEKVYSL